MHNPEHYRLPSTGISQPWRVPDLLHILRLRFPLAKATRAGLTSKRGLHVIKAFRVGRAGQGKAGVAGTVGQDQGALAKLWAQGTPGWTGKWLQH